MVSKKPSTDMSILSTLVLRIHMYIFPLQHFLNLGCAPLKHGLLQDVPIPSSSKQGAGKPHPPELQELDTYIDSLGSSIAEFGRSSANALERANKEISGGDMADAEVDVMPRDEVFLISSFLLNLRQAA